MRGFKKTLGVLAVSGAMSACTNINDPNILSLRALDCFAGAACGCMRSIVDIIAPNVGSGASLNNYKSLTPYLATAPLANVRFGLEGGVDNNFLGANFFVRNRFGTFVLRAGQRLNNYMAIVNRFRVGIPTDDPSWAWLENTTIDLGVVTSSGGVRLRTRSPGGVWQDVINDPTYYRSRLHCAQGVSQSPPANRITLHLGQWTEVELTSNIADGSNALFDPITYTRAFPQAGESSTYVAGAYGGTHVLGGFTWGTETPPAGIPIITPDLSACEHDYYHPDDPQLTTASPGTFNFIDLAAKRFFGLPKELIQVTTPDALANGNLPYCNVTQ